MAGVLVRASSSSMRGSGLELAALEPCDVVLAEDLAGDHPVAVLHLEDPDPGELANVLSPDPAEGVGGDAHHLLLLLGGPAPLDDVDVDERHASSFVAAACGPCEYRL